MAIQKTLPAKHSLVGELQFTPPIWADNLYIKIDEITVIDPIALGIADAMGVVTGRARRLLIHDMFLMFRKALVAQYTLPAVAFIAQGIGVRCFFGEIKGYVVSLKEILKTGAMGSLRSHIVIVVVAVYTGDDAIDGIGAQKAWHRTINAL